MITFSKSQIFISVILTLYLFQFIGNIMEFDPIKPSVIISTIDSWISSIIQPVTEFLFIVITSVCMFIWNSLIEIYKFFVQPIIDVFLSLFRACYNLLPSSITTFVHATSYDMLLTYFFIFLGFVVIAGSCLAMLDIIYNHPN
jgi:hypothetical protein